MILGRGENTGGVFSERAGRAVGIVEIQHDLTILDRLGVIVSAGRIRLLPTGQVFELNEQFVIFYFGHIQLVGFAFKLKSDKSIQAVFHDIAEDIRLVRYFRRGIGSITRLETKLCIDREPFQGWERETLLSIIVPDADGIFAGVFMQYHAETMPCNKTRLWLLVGFEDGILYQFAVD